MHAHETANQETRVFLENIAREFESSADEVVGSFIHLDRTSMGPVSYDFLDPLSEQI
jgi:hypothetical protein